MKNDKYKMPIGEYPTGNQISVEILNDQFAIAEEDRKSVLDFDTLVKRGNVFFDPKLEEEERQSG